MNIFDDGSTPAVAIPGCPLKIKYIDDMGIPRAFDDRPIIRQPCPDRLPATTDDAGWAAVCNQGRVPGARKGTTKKCPTCKGSGEKWGRYSRVTSYIGCLEDETNIEKWHIQRLLAGLALQPQFMEEVLAFNWPLLNELDLQKNLETMTPDELDTFRSLKRTLNDLSARMQQVGGVDRSSDQGTHVHELTQEIDSGRPLPPFTYVPDKDMRIPVTLQDRADVAAWRRKMEELEAEILAVEKFTVHDELGAAGTMDRLLNINALKLCDQCDKPTVGDLKTGSILYGGGEMPMQLAIYSRSVEYDPETGARTPQDACTHRGLIINLPAGSGNAKCYVADLEYGWGAVGLATRVRVHGNESKKALWPLVTS